jgi:tol-pal system protein YbgF
MRDAIMTPLRLALFSSLLWGSGLTHAGLFEDEEARRAILDLRQRAESSQNALKAQAEDNAQLRRVLLDLQSQIDGLRAEVNQVRGAQEQLGRDLADTQQRQSDLQSGTDERLRRFEPVKVSVDGREFMADPAEKREYEAALDIFRKGDFQAAQAALQRFVSARAQSGYLPSALFWLGNASYATQDYRNALAQFRQMLSAAPTHVRAPEAMLAISNVQIELKDIKAARKTLEELIKTSPDSDAGKTAKERLAKLR